VAKGGQHFKSEVVVLEVVKGEIGALKEALLIRRDVLQQMRRRVDITQEVRRAQKREVWRPDNEVSYRGRGDLSEEPP